MGAGRTELLTAMFGSFPGRVSGDIFIQGQQVKISRPADAISHGIGFVTEDRKGSGLMLEQTVLWNMTLASLPRLSRRFLTDESREIAASHPLFQRLRIKAKSLFTGVGTLPAWNQQQVVLAQGVLKGTRVLFLDE